MSYFLTDDGLLMYAPDTDRMEDEAVSEKPEAPLLPSFADLPGSSEFWRAWIEYGRLRHQEARDVREYVLRGTGPIAERIKEAKR